MGLKWGQTKALADALSDAHPDAKLDRLSIDDVVLMVRALPEFDDVLEPEDPEQLHRVLYVWATDYDHAGF